MGFALSDMRLTSPAFDDGGAIPTRHTGEAEDVSPALSWSDVPDGTKSFALICHDPDAPLVKPGAYGFVHWVLYGIPGDATELPEGYDAYVQGVNDFGCRRRDTARTTISSGGWRSTMSPTCPQVSRCGSCSTRSSRTLSE